MSFILRAAGFVGAGVLATAAFAGLASADISGNTNYSTQVGVKLVDLDADRSRGQR